MKRILEVDCLRGVAAISVFLFHASGYAGFDKRIITLGELKLPNPFSLGASGVTLFFIISGFCLVYQQLKQNPGGMGRKAITEYARHRVARILPAYWVAIALSIPVALSLPHQTLTMLGPNVLAHVFFLQGLSPLWFISLNGALWSMATEAEFYVAFPVLYNCCRKVRPLVFVASAAVLTLLFRVAVTHMHFAPVSGATITWGATLTYQLPGRLFEFALGMWLADLLLKREAVARQLFLFASFACMPLLLFRLIGPDWFTDIAMALVLCPVVGFAVSTSRRRSSTVHSILKHTAKFGRASYSFFLIHVPILQLVAVRNTHAASHWRNLTILCGVSFPISCMLAYALYKGVEKPIWNRFRTVRVPAPLSEMAAS